MTGMPSGESLLAVVRRLARSETHQSAAKKQRRDAGSADLLHSGTGAVLQAPSVPAPPQPAAPLAPALCSAAFFGNARQRAVDLAVQRFLAGVKHRLQPAAPYEVFATQAAAFTFADSHADEHDLR